MTLVGIKQKYMISFCSVLDCAVASKSYTEYILQ